MDQSLLRLFFIVLTIIGVAIPYAAFLPFVFEHGLDFSVLIQQAAANRVAAFAWLDVIISAVTLLIAIFIGKLITIRQGTAVAILTCLAGVSAGLPLFFYFLLSDKKS